jgi:hypothetical protein
MAASIRNVIHRVSMPEKDRLINDIAALLNRQYVDLRWLDGLTNDQLRSLRDFIRAIKK